MSIVQSKMVDLGRDKRREEKFLFDLRKVVKLSNSNNGIIILH